MSVKDWRRVREAMLDTIRHQIIVSLSEIAKCFEITGDSFDETFRMDFYRLTNSV